MYENFRSRIRFIFDCIAEVEISDVWKTCTDTRDGNSRAIWVNWANNTFNKKKKNSFFSAAEQ